MNKNLFTDYKEAHNDRLNCFIWVKSYLYDLITIASEDINTIYK